MIVNNVVIKHNKKGSVIKKIVMTAPIISIPDFSSFRENIDTAADQLSGSKWYKCISFETTKLLTQNPFFLSIYILQSPPSQKYLRIYISLHHTLPLCIYCADTKRDPSNEQASSLTLIHNSSVIC